MPLGRVPDGAGGCYTIPMGLCYDCGFWALTVAPALPLPGDYALPLGSRRGINQHGELAVAEGPLRGEQPTADRDRFPFICGEGVREFVAGLSGHNLTAKGGNRGCRSGRLCRPDGQVPLPESALALCAGQWSVGAIASLLTVHPATVSPRRVAMGGRWSDVAQQSADERVPFPSLSA